MSTTHRLPSIAYLRSLAKLVHDEGLVGLQLPHGSGHIVLTGGGYRPTIGADKDDKPADPQGPKTDRERERERKARLVPDGVDPDVLFPEGI